MSDPIFPQGMIVKRPVEGAPDFVKANIAIKVDEFIEWLKANKDGDWMNFDIKSAKETGKLYVSLNTWKPKSTTQ